MIYSVHIFCKYVIKVSPSKQKPGKVLDPAKWFYGRSQKKTHIPYGKHKKNSKISHYILFMESWDFFLYQTYN